MKENRVLKILLLAPQPFYQHRGTPIAVRELSEKLGSRGDRIDLLVFHEGEDIALPNCCIHRIPAVPGTSGVRPGFSLKKLICDAVMFFSAIRMLRRGKYDLIHAVEEAAFMGIVFKWLFRVPYIYDMDSSLTRQLTDKHSLAKIVRPILNRMESLAIRQSEGVVVVCKALEDLVRTSAPEKPILRLEDKSLLDRRDDSASAATQLPMKSPIIMYVGNLESYQGIDLLLESHQIVLERFPEANLVVIGGTRATISHYQRMAERLGIAERTHFLGPHPTSVLGQLLGQADVLASPRTEGNNTPMKIYSYLDSGRPVVATRLPTHTQVLDDEIAWLAEPTPDDFALGVIKLLEDPEQAELIAYRARIRVEEEYSDAAFERKLGGFYGQLEDRFGVTAAAGL